MVSIFFINVYYSMIFLSYGNIVALICIIFTLQISYAKGLYLHLLCYSSVNASQESCLGTVENDEHTKDTLIL